MAKFALTRAPTKAQIKFPVAAPTADMVQLQNWQQTATLYVFNVRLIQHYSR